jgi:hypothetical protein
MSLTPVQRANQVSILAACQIIGLDLPPGVDYGRAVKVHCPFGAVHHADGGVEAAMRVYDDHVYCFAGCGSFSPVSLVAHAFDIPRSQAARELLDRAGMTAVDSREAVDIWSELAAEPEPDTARLAEALKTFCRRTAPDWSARQFESGISQMLSACLGLLRHVRTAAQADQWLTSCKVFMAHQLTHDD